MAADRTPIPDDYPLALKEAVAFATRDFTQKRIEALTGIDQGRLSKIMNPSRPERPTLSEIARLEDVIGKRRGYLLTLAGYVSSDGVRQAGRDATSDDVKAFRADWAARGKPAKARKRGPQPGRKRTPTPLKRAAKGGRTAGKRAGTRARPSTRRRRES